MPRIVAIVCAKDEAPRIGAVLDVLVPIIPTLVVDDGSTDGTHLVAKSKGAAVLRLPTNRGKGRAMLAGYLCAKRIGIDSVFFCDADLIGLDQEHVATAVNGLSQGFDMVVGLRDYGSTWNRIQPRLPLISGERAVRTKFLDTMPRQAWDGYGVEVAMNDHVARNGGIIGTVVFENVSIVKKWSKDNHLGAAKMVDMVAEVYKACEATVERAILPRTIIGLDPQPQLNQGSYQYAAEAQKLPEQQMSMTPSGDGLNYGVSSGRGAPLERKRSPSIPSVYRAPQPATLSAKNASTEEVMGKLSSSIVEAAKPALLPPIWTVATCICGVLMGPFGAIGAGCIGLAHCLSCDPDCDSTGHY